MTQKKYKPASQPSRTSKKHKKYSHVESYINENTYNRPSLKIYNQDTYTEPHGFKEKKLSKPQRGCETIDMNNWSSKNSATRGCTDIDLHLDFDQ